MDLQRSRILDIEFRHLRAFVEVCGELNFTRAAVRLHTTQPSLSRSIAGLERAVGVVLLQRDRRSVALTPAGSLFLTYARRAIGTLEEGVDAATVATLGLRVCFAGPTGEVTGPAVQAFERLCPGIPVSLRRYDDPLASLTDESSHVAILLGDPQLQDGFDTVVLGEEPRMAALPSGHRLADARSLALADLLPETLVMNVLAGTASIDLWPPGSGPAQTLRVRNIDEWMEVIALGRGVGITPASTARFYRHPHVRFLAISDAPPVPVILAWRTGHPHPNIPEFIAAAQESLR
jgi:DNA-binding transcriptional LysR family regulator